MIGTQVKCVEEFQTVNDWYGNKYGTGTVKVGDTYTIIKEPTPEKKKFKLIRTTKFGDELLYLRKSELNKYFEKKT